MSVENYTPRQVELWLEAIYRAEIIERKMQAIDNWNATRASDDNFQKFLRQLKV